MSASPSFKTKSARGLRWIVSAAVINPKSAVRSSFWEGAGALGACVHQDMSPLAGPTHEADGQEWGVGVGESWLSKTKSWAAPQSSEFTMMI